MISSISYIIPETPNFQEKFAYYTNLFFKQDQAGLDRIRQDIAQILPDPVKK